METEIIHLSDFESKKEFYEWFFNKPLLGNSELIWETLVQFGSIEVSYK